MLDALITSEFHSVLYTGLRLIIFLWEPNACAILIINQKCMINKKFLKVSFDVRFVTACHFVVHNYGGYNERKVGST